MKYLKYYVKAFYISAFVLSLCFGFAGIVYIAENYGAIYFIPALLTYLTLLYGSFLVWLDR